MSDMGAVPGGIFDGGPFDTLQRKLHLMGKDRRLVYRRALFVMAISWLPLLLLSLIEGTWFSQEEAFLSDFAVHARYLIAAPLLVIAEIICPPRMNAIALNFLATGLVLEKERDRFVDAALLAIRGRDSVRAEISIAILAYAVTGLLMVSVPLEVFPKWQYEIVGGRATYSIAGWWHYLVSTPLLRGLMLWWLWRIFLWSRFLWQVSRLNLQLVPSHPDRAAGLMFVAYSVRACGIFGFIFGVIAAGPMANLIVHVDETLASLRYIPIGLLAFNLIVFSAPLLCFSPNLLQAWRRGTFEYGALACGLGRRFEHEWLSRKNGVEQDALGAPDFSATTDLYSIVSNVYAMNFIPLDIKSLLFMGVITLLPFLPVVVLAVPLDVVFERLAGLFF